MYLRRHLACVVTVIALLLPGLNNAADLNMGRVVNLAYGNEGGPQITNYSPSTILQYLSEIQPNMSAIINYMLNVPSTRVKEFRYLLDAFNASNVPVYPAVGDPTKAALTDPSFLSIARGYAKFTDCIQVDGLQTYTESFGGIDDIYSFVEKLIKFGFQHIQLNPWPLMSDHTTAYPFPYSQVDSAIEQVELMENNVTYKVIPDPSNWTVNPNKINAIWNYNHTIQIIVNYENKPEEAALSTLSLKQQLAAFKKTIANISGFPNNNGRLHWTAPWSSNYDPIANGSWPFMVKQFNKGNP